MQSEVGFLSKMQHENIITLLGYCIHGEARFIVYELMQNGSLETQLYGKELFHHFTYNFIEVECGY